MIGLGNRFARVHERLIRDALDAGLKIEDDRIRLVIRRSGGIRVTVYEDGALFYQGAKATVDEARRVLGLPRVK